MPESQWVWRNLFGYKSGGLPSAFQKRIQPLKKCTPKLSNEQDLCVAIVRTPLVRQQRQWNVDEFVS